MSRYLRQLARETHARLAPPSALRLGPLAPARFEEIYAERSAPGLPTGDVIKPPPVAPQQLRPAAPPNRASQPTTEMLRSAPPSPRPPAPPAPPAYEVSTPSRLTLGVSTTEGAVTWEFLQELSDSFVHPNAAPIEPAAPIERATTIEPAATIASNIATEPLRGSRRPNAAPASIPEAQFDVTIGRIDVTIEAEPQPPVRAQRRAPRAVSPSKPAPLSATGRLARQYLDR